MIVKNIRTSEKEEIEKITEIKTANKIKYLGIWVTGNKLDLYKDNYDKTWKGIKQELERWDKMQFSILERIATIKMVILPKMLYLFRMLPIIERQKNFPDWKKDIKNYV